MSYRLGRQNLIVMSCKHISKLNLEKGVISVAGRF